jgi:hypothetical protein
MPHQPYAAEPASVVEAAADDNGLLRRAECWPDAYLAPVNAD